MISTIAKSVTLALLTSQTFPAFNSGSAQIVRRRIVMTSPPFTLHATQTNKHMMLKLLNQMISIMQNMLLTP